MDVFLTGSVFHHTSDWHPWILPSLLREKQISNGVNLHFSQFPEISPSSFTSCFPCLLCWKSSYTGMCLLTADSKNGVRKHPERVTWKGRGRWERCRTGSVCHTALGNWSAPVASFKISRSTKDSCCLFCVLQWPQHSGRAIWYQHSESSLLRWVLPLALSPFLLTWL